MCKKLLRWATLFVSAVMLVLSQKNAAENLAALRLLLSATSLRYEQALTEQQVLKTVNGLQSGQNAEGLFAAFWREDRAALSAEATRRTLDGVLTVSVYGDVQAAYGASYRSGTAPPIGADDMCAVSAPLAWALWGSTDVLGQEVQLRVENETAALTVCGVFEAREELLLRGAGPERGFSCVEITGLSRDNPFAQCGLFVQQTGIGRPQQTVYGEQIAALFSACAFLPWGFAIVFLLLALGRLCRTKWEKRVFALFCAIGFAAVCAAALHGLPAWLIPNRWADAPAWRTVAELVGAQWEQWLTLCPTGKDVAVKRCMAALCPAWGGEAFGFLLFAQTVAKRNRSK